MLSAVSVNYVWADSRLQLSSRNTSDDGCFTRLFCTVIGCFCWQLDATCLCVKPLHVQLAHCHHLYINFIRCCLSSASITLLLHCWWGCNAKYCDQRVCMFVCLKNYMSKFCQILCTCYLWTWLDPLMTAMHYVMYFWFYDVIFTYWSK